ncbi:unnamed protein product [Owenia fusiformis]|uniref:Uncharacterized protein n=1 Tax=Owenia fusiformis TaxID=6347 RepID=A0A8J1U0X2_OWEFU|nr:unnamed protein product [Owenia fusiformis]
MSLDSWQKKGGGENITATVDRNLTITFPTPLNKSLCNINKNIDAGVRYGSSSSPTTVEIWTTCGIIILIIGTLGNVFTIVVLSRKNMRKKTTAMFLTYLACVDTLALWVGLFPNWLAKSSVSLDIVSDVGCKLLAFLAYTPVQLSAWILVMVSNERVIAVYLPTKVNQICAKRMAVCTLAVITFFICAINLHMFWVNGVVDVRTSKCGVSKSECGVLKEYLYVWEVHLRWLDATIASILPFIIMLIANCMIIGKIVLHHTNQSKNKAKVTSMTIMLLVCNFAFIILTLPIVLLEIFKSQWYQHFKDEKHDNFFKEREDLELHSTVCQMFQYLNHAINFIMYCFAGPAFRRELLCMMKENRYLRKIACCENVNRVGEPSSNVTQSTTGNGTFARGTLTPVA